MKDFDFARYYTCCSHTPKNCWQPTDEERNLPLMNGRLYAPVATIKKLSELRGADGDYNQALLALEALPEAERALYPMSDSAVEWPGVPKEEWKLLTYCYRDFANA